MSGWWRVMGVKGELVCKAVSFIDHTELSYLARIPPHKAKKLKAKL